MLFKSSMADTLLPVLGLLFFFCNRAMKFWFRELDLGVAPSVCDRGSVRTGDTRLGRLAKVADGSLRPRTFRLDLAQKRG